MFEHWNFRFTDWLRSLRTQPTKPRSRRRSVSADAHHRVIEILESRRLLTNLVAVHVDGNSISLNDFGGHRSSGGDDFNVTYTSSQVVLTGNNGTSFRVGSQTLSTYTIDITAPPSISMNLGGRSNTVNVTAGASGSSTTNSDTETQSAATTTPTITGTYDSVNGPKLNVSVNGRTYTLGTDSQLTTPSAGKWSLDLTGNPLTTQTTTVTATSYNTQGDVATGTGTITSQQAIIASYLTAQHLTATKTASGLNYVITSQGSGAIPTKGKSLSVNYTGYLLNANGTLGTKFDSNTDSQFGHVTPFVFTLGAGAVIKGWDEAFALLPVGTTAKLIIPSALAYGTTGSGSSIPANSILVFDVTVVSAT